MPSKIVLLLFFLSPIIYAQNDYIFIDCAPDNDPKYCSYKALSSGLANILNSIKYADFKGDKIVISTSLNFDEKGEIYHDESIIYNSTVGSYMEFEALLKVLPKVYPKIKDGKTVDLKTRDTFYYIQSKNGKWEPDYNRIPKEEDYNIPYKPVVFEGCDPNKTQKEIKKCNSKLFDYILKLHFKEIEPNKYKRMLKLKETAYLNLIVTKEGKTVLNFVSSESEEIKEELEKIANFFPNPQSPKRYGGKPMRSELSLRIPVIVRPN